MLDNPTSMHASTNPDCDTLFRIRVFLATQAPGLEAAAQLLGGQRWSGRVRQLCVDVSDGSLPSRACLRELKALLGLLRLESVYDLTSEEAACFAMIDPTDPRIFEICLITDRLAQFLDEYQARPPADASQT